VRWFARFSILLLLMILIGISVVSILCIESIPLVEKKPLLSLSNAERAKVLLREYDPRKLRSGEIKTVSMSEEELSLVTNHLINGFGTGAAAFEIEQDRLTIMASVNLSGLLPGRYVNFKTQFNTVSDGARFGKLQIGLISVPAAIMRGFVTLGAEHIYRATGLPSINTVLHAVVIRDRQLEITYQWQEEIVKVVRDRFVSRTDRALMRAYNDFLATKFAEKGTDLSFANLVHAIFKKARDRSPSTDPVVENRAAIVILAAYVNGSNISSFVPEAANWVKPRRVRLKIHSRRDLVRHFATSAALAVAGGGVMSSAIGLYKEVGDADGGSGFSFQDLAADKAGAQFGHAAVESEFSAKRLQDRIARGIDEMALIPKVNDLEENLSEAEFQGRYGGIKGVEYERVVEDIDRRIADSVLYRP
tara:strand:- start:1580 stop:2836 length:1257 start_codon:yes stop_codon:yes gene_type:complete